MLLLEYVGIAYRNIYQSLPRTKIAFGAFFCNNLKVLSTWSIISSTTIVGPFWNRSGLWSRIKDFCFGFSAWPPDWVFFILLMAVLHRHPWYARGPRGRRRKGPPTVPRSLTSRRDQTPKKFDDIFFCQIVTTTVSVFFWFPDIAESL